VPKKTRPWVEEFPHAYLIHHISTVAAAREVLIGHLGGKSDAVKRMPARPFYNGDHSCVAMYFNIGPACVCHKQTNPYKP